MGATVSYIESDGLIRVREFGELTDEEFHGSIRKIHELCSATGCRRVLVDATAQTSRTDFLAAFERGSFAAELLQKSAVRIAVVLVPTLVEGHAVFETVSVNRGLKVQLFDSEATARSWLAQA